MAKVSIIITVYNTAKYLPECMESVLGQTFDDIEIILVDDGSTDGVSSGMCDTYAEKDNRVKVIHKENGGLMSAWMSGVDVSTADYLFFVDSDDWIDKDMVEEYYSHVSEGNADSEIIAGNYILEKPGEQKKASHGLKAGEYTGSALDEVKTRIQGQENRPVTMSRCMKLISKKLVTDNMKYCNPQIVMGEDANITIPCLCDCTRLLILDGAYSYHYRQLAGSMAHGYNPNLFNNILLNISTFRGILKEKKIKNGDTQMDKEFVMLLLLVMRNELRAGVENTTGRIKDIFLRDDVRSNLLRTRVDIHSKANKVLYFTARHPNALIVSFTKALIKTYDRCNNS